MSRVTTKDMCSYFKSCTNLLDPPLTGRERADLLAIFQQNPPDNLAAAIDEYGARHNFKPRQERRKEVLKPAEIISEP